MASLFSERRRRDRRKPTRKTFSLKQFLRDYPIVPVVVISFSVGAFGGYMLGWGKALNQKAADGKILKQISMAQASVPAPLVSVPVPKRMPPPVVEKPPVETYTEAQTAVPTVVNEEKPPVQEISKKPKIAFVIDDIGYNKHYAELLFSINRPLTIAILPKLAYSKYYADEAKKRNIPAILHLPLEPENPNENPGAGAIMSYMSIGEIKEMLEEDLASVPTAIGVNNHMGSRATRDRTVMYSILKEIKDKNLFFLDSLTHPHSVAYQVAYGLDMPALKRDVFLDNTDDFDYITSQIIQTANIAEKTGFAVAIGHPRDNTLRAIKEKIPQLEKRGFEIVPIAQLLKK